MKEKGIVANRISTPSCFLFSNPFLYASTTATSPLSHRGTTVLLTTHLEAGVSGQEALE